MSTQCIRIQLVDDHEIVRTGLRHLLEKEDDMQVVVESATGKQACLDYDTYQPDMLVMDISMPDISGLEVMRRILQDHPQARILLLSMYGGMVVQRAMQMGACGYIRKNSGIENLISAVHEIMQGERHFDDESDAEMPAEPVNLDKVSPSLTKRELEICMDLVNGKSVAEIGRALHLSEKTVYTHRQHIMNKLGANTLIELAQVASHLGIFS